MSIVMSIHDAKGLAAEMIIVHEKSNDKNYHTDKHTSSRCLRALHVSPSHYPGPGAKDLGVLGQLELSMVFLSSKPF